MTTETIIEPLDPAVYGWYSPVLAGAIDGSYTLPPGVWNWCHAANVVSAAAAAATRDNVSRFPVSWRLAWIRSRANAVSLGSLGTSLTTEQLEASVAELAALEEAARVSMARRDLFEETSRKVLDLADSMFSEGLLPDLRSAAEEVFASLRELPQDTPRDAQAALDAPKEAQAAFRQLQTLQGRYSAIRRGFDGLRGNPMLPDLRDSGQLFGDTPIRPKGHGAPTINLGVFRRAGPASGLDRLLWLSQPGNAWLPSVAEQDAVFTAFRFDASQGSAVVSE